MENSNLDNFIFIGSPFIPKFPSGFVDQLFSQVRKDQQPPQLVISKDLLTIGEEHQGLLIENLNSLYSRFKTTGNDLYYFTLGYALPLILICSAFFFELKGPEVAKQYVESVNANSEEERKFTKLIKESYIHCHQLLLDDTTCSTIFTYASSNPISQNLYYQVGIESARVSFFVCNVEVLKMMGLL